MRISDWSSDVCSSDLSLVSSAGGRSTASARSASASGRQSFLCAKGHSLCELLTMARRRCLLPGSNAISRKRGSGTRTGFDRHCDRHVLLGPRSEEHTSELQSLMRISYAVFCLKKKTRTLQAQRVLILYDTHA